MKEQSEKLFCAIGDVGDDLIARADAPVKKAPRVWVKWAALAACCALVIGAAAFVVPMFHAGSTAPETASAPMAASAPTADTAALESPAEEEMSLEAAEAPAEPMAEAAPAEAEPAGQKTRTLPGADCFTVVPESITCTSADFTLTNEDDTVLALRSDYWLEALLDGEWQPLAANLLKAQSQTDEAAQEPAVCTLHYDWQTLCGALEPGDYRLAQPVILPDGTDYTLYAEFTVE